jgi:hypothetical protein
MLRPASGWLVQSLQQYDSLCTGCESMPLGGACGHGVTLRINNKRASGNVYY